MHKIIHTTIYFKDGTHISSDITHNVDNIQKHKSQMKAESQDIHHILFNYESEGPFKKANS